MTGYNTRSEQAISASGEFRGLPAAMTYNGRQAASTVGLLAALLLGQAK